MTKTTGWTHAVKTAEIDYAFSYIKLAPNNQSPWLYVKGYVTRYRQSRAIDHEFLTLIII